MSTQPHILLNLYYSVMENIRFHEEQLSRLERRANDIQQEIINNSEMPYILRPQTHTHTTNRTTPRRSSTHNYLRRNTSPINTRSTTQSTTQSTSPSPPTDIPSLSPLETPIPDNYSFNYIRSSDTPIVQQMPLSTSFARSLLNRASLSPPSLSQTNLTDTGSLLLYFMLENIQNDTIREEQHGITDPMLYITDMLFRDIDNPANTCCPIQMDVFTETSEVSQINKCKHIFCRQEIRRWLETHHTCPLCRTAIDE
jgi:hypothetical protein